MSPKSTPLEPPKVAADPPQDTTTSDKPLPEHQPKSPSTKSQSEGGDDHILSVHTGSDGRGSSTSARSSSQESGEASPVAPLNSATTTSSAPPLPNEEPPLPDEQPPAQEDDGWDYYWDATRGTYIFWNKFTNETTLENPRASQTASTAVPVAQPPQNERLPAGGYNPAIHGDYDPNAWYAQNNEDNAAQQEPMVDPSAAYAAIGYFNRFSGRWQDDDQNPDRHNDEAKSKRQMGAFFDVDAAANSHNGRSLKAERSGKKPSKKELKEFKEKRRAKKEEKRRAWLRD